MSEPITYTVLAVTARFVLARDSTGRRDKQFISGPVEVEKGDTLTAEQWQSMGAQPDA